MSIGVHSWLAVFVAAGPRVAASCQHLAPGYFESQMSRPPNTALERTAAALVRTTVAAVRTRTVRPTVPVGGCRSAWVR